MFNRSRALVTAVLALGAAFMPAPLQSAMSRPEVTVSAKRKKGLFNGRVFPSGGTLTGTKSVGGSVARDKRAAVKRRNQLRYKQAVRR